MTSAVRRRAVITGMGVVFAGGTDLGTFWSELARGTSFVVPITRFDVSAYPSQIAAEIPDAVLPRVPPEVSERGRITTYAALAAERALVDARLPPTPPERVGVVIGAGLGSYDHEEVFGPFMALPSSAESREFVEMVRHSLKPRAAERRTPGSIPAFVAERHGFAGPVMSVMTACAGGTQALGDALRWIRSGRADAVLTGASDSELYPMGLASFCLLGALSTRNAEPARASRPFDAGRDGFVIGEGAGVLVLEERERALSRGAHVYAELAGFGSACDAFRVTDPHPDGLGAVLAMRRAIADAGLSPEEIGYVNAHGTSTPANDRIEALALRKVFGGRRVPVSSTKSMIGHLTVAAGAVEAIATALTLENQTLLPTINYEVPDPECDLDVVPNAARPATVDTALSNSFAFGGQMASLVLTRHSAAVGERRMPGRSQTETR